MPGRDTAEAAEVPTIRDGIAAGHPRVAGHCPACAGASLFLGTGGYITCARISCPRPDAAAALLDDDETGHIVHLGSSEFTVRHPLAERLDDALLDCPLPPDIAAYDGPPAQPGRYRVNRAGDGWNWEPLPDNTAPTT